LIESAHSLQEVHKQSFVDREAAWEIERSVLESECNELRQKVDSLGSEHRSSHDAWEARLVSLDQELCKQQEAGHRQLAELLAERAVVAVERDQLAQELAAAREATETPDEHSAIESEHNELKQKFDLALRDVQTFRLRVADLEAELARRPAANQTDSAELLHLRAERDALATRIEELESQPIVQVDADSAQQFDDLRRRFEMAVEDVRELKTRNAEIESQLSEARQKTVSPADSSMDWESQKRRMLASLEGEADDSEPHRQEDRLTIRNTIEITDAVVAEKDQEIEELKVQLASRTSQPPEADAERELAVQKLIDTDEVIAQHRQRIAHLEKEVEEKLRAAELELSIERAKITRDKADVEEQRLEIETGRQSRSARDPAPGTGSPRRRWLSKLGLNGEEQG
jgi:chromosome segregation ATPase